MMHNLTILIIGISELPAVDILLKIAIDIVSKLTDRESHAAIRKELITHLLGYDGCTLINGEIINGMIIQ
jgi:hypothetical protein